MAQVYIDSSVAVAILFQEEGYELLLKRSERMEKIFSSDLLKAEIYAAATREGMPFEEAEKLLKHVTISLPSRSLQSEYYKILSSGYCRGSDLHHLATFLYIDPTMSRLELFTSDARQEEIARKVGIKVFQS